MIYSCIFNEKFNISFFSLKRDLRNTCESYKNTPEYPALKEQYNAHQEKVLSRIEKDTDKINFSKASVVSCLALKARFQFQFQSRLNPYKLSCENCNDNADFILE